jgi:small-conductance mechanosensitive channel
MVVENREYLQQKARHLLGWVAVLLWIYFVLGALSIRTDAVAEARAMLAVSVQLGSIKFTLGNLLSFAVTMWVAALASSALRFALREEVYPRVTLAPGLQYSISKMAHYAVLIIGLFAALTALGVPLTHLTILASALSVGLGFGLQNIVNNFVSGIILLFERPVKVGDIIVVDNTEGIVTRIGIRASVMRSINGSEIIIPNGNFISNSVTNWTLSGRQLVINIALSLAPGMEAGDVLNLLRQAAVAHPQILKEPAPEALLLNLTGGSLNFQLRAWANENADWLKVRSDITLAVNTAVTAQKYTIK